MNVQEQVDNNEWGALPSEERLRQNESADIEFRSAGGECQACLTGALPVWQAVQVVRSYGLDPERTAGHFGWPVRRIRAALNYYEAFPAEIEQAIGDSHAMTETTLKRLLPQTSVLALPAFNSPASHPAFTAVSGSDKRHRKGAMDLAALPRRARNQDV